MTEEEQKKAIEMFKEGLTNARKEWEEEQAKKKNATPPMETTPQKTSEKTAQTENVDKTPDEKDKRIKELEDSLAAKTKSLEQAQKAGKNNVSTHKKNYGLDN